MNKEVAQEVIEELVGEVIDDVLKKIELSNEIVIDDKPEKIDIFIKTIIDNLGYPRRKISSKRFLNNFNKESDIFLNVFLKMTQTKKGIDEYKVKNTLNSGIYLIKNSDEFIDNKIHKVWDDGLNRNNRIILKELNTSTYIMSFTNLLLIVFDKDDNSYCDFNLLYNQSDEYLFHVYENSKYYYVFCVSKYKDEIFSNVNLENDSLKQNVIKMRYMNWLIMNDANIKYTLLTSVYDAFLVMNKHWNCNNNVLNGIPSLHKSIYIYKCTIGEAKVNKEIDILLKTSINIINKYYMPSLPYNYLSY